MAGATKDSRRSNTATGSKPYRILIADDHSVFRRGMRSLLEQQPGLEVCGESATGTGTIEAVRQMRPNLVILDLMMPDMNGLEAARVMREESPGTEVMIVSAHLSEELAREVLLAGAKAYVLKSDAERDVLAAVDHVRHHQSFFTGQLTASMTQMFMEGGNGGSVATEGGALSPRELQVLQLLADGKSNKQAAAALNISARTVESHRQRIMHKMQFGSFSELVRFAVRNNLVEL